MNLLTKNCNIFLEKILIIFPKQNTKTPSNIKAVNSKTKQQQKKQPTSAIRHLS